MANVLSDEKKQQVLALGRLGWSLRWIQQATGVRRETASLYLKAAQIPVRPPGASGPHLSNRTRDPRSRRRYFSRPDGRRPEASRANRLAPGSPPRSYCQCL